MPDAKPLKCKNEKASFQLSTATVWLTPNTSESSPTKRTMLSKFLSCHAQDPQQTSQPKTHNKRLQVQSYGASFCS
eukprot:5062670-Amphidinium_carterae.1